MPRRKPPVALAALAALALGAIPAAASADIVNLQDNYNDLLCGVYNATPQTASIVGPIPCSPSSDYSQVSTSIGSFNLQPLNPLTEPVEVTTQQVTNSTGVNQSESVGYSQAMTESHTLTNTYGVGLTSATAIKGSIGVLEVSETITVSANFSQSQGYSSSDSRTFTETTNLVVPPGCTYAVSSWIEQATYSPTFTGTVLLTGTANNSYFYASPPLYGPTSMTMQQLFTNYLSWYTTASNWPSLYGWPINTSTLASDSTYQTALTQYGEAGWNWNGSALSANVSGVWNGIEGTQADSSYSYVSGPASCTSTSGQSASAVTPRIGYYRRDQGDGGPLAGSDGSDVLKGGRRADRISGLGGRDLVFAGPGDDVISAGGGKDHVDAGPGDDVVRLSGGDDSTRAGAGDDLIDAGGGRDLVRGGPGDDRILLGGGDLAFGDAGKDTFVVGRFGAPATVADLQAHDTVVLADPRYRGELRRWARDPQVVHSWSPRAQTTAPVLLASRRTGVVAFDPDGTGPRRPAAVLSAMTGLAFNGGRRISVFGGAPVRIVQVDLGIDRSTPISPPPAPPG